MAGATELQERDVLRVCSDPGNMPYSNKKGEGFENKIAALMGAEMGLPIEYAWYSLNRGFVRSTLNMRLCDIIIGTGVANPLLLNTNPYYFSAFTIMLRDGELPELSSLKDDRFKGDFSIGVLANSPPSFFLFEHDLKMTAYRPTIDSMFGSPYQQMVQDLLDKKTDATILWGPYAGYFAGQHPGRIALVPMLEDQHERIRLIYATTMGVRHNELQWKRQINRFIQKNKLAIDEILQEYNIVTVKQ